MVTIARLWVLFWVLTICTAGVATWLVSTWWREAIRWWRTAVGHRRAANAPVQLLPIAQEFLRAQARIGRAKHGAHTTAEARDEPGPAIPAATPEHARWQTRVRGTGRRIGVGATWFGRVNILIGLLAAMGVVRGWIWELQRHPPLPPGATQILETAIGNLALQTSYRVPEDIPTVRAFYARELAARGWAYCGTQATPGCSNLTPTLVAADIDVYRRVRDVDHVGDTIELWPQRDPNGNTFVTVSETRAP